MTGTRFATFQMAISSPMTLHARMMEVHVVRKTGIACRMASAGQLMDIVSDTRVLIRPGKTKNVHGCALLVSCPFQSYISSVLI